MGSFNTTCFASQQTIKPGERCYVIPLRQQRGYNHVKLSRKGKEFEVFANWSSTCYATAFWEPVGRAFLANYDDYGNVFFETPEWNLVRLRNFIKDSKPKFFKAEQGENQYHDHPFDPEEFAGKINCIDSMQYLWKAAMEERVFMADYHGVPCQFTFAIVSEIAYNHLIDDLQKKKSWDGKSLKISVKINKIMKELDDLKKHMKDHFFVVMNLMEQHFRFEDGMCPWSLDLNNVCDRYLKDEIEKDRVKDVLTGFMREKYFYCALNNLNIRFSPMVYASQDYSNEIGQDYKKFVNKCARDLKKLHDAEDF